MAWIPLHHELREHPKVKRVARDLGLSRPAVIGHLGMLWAWCMHYASDGEITRFDSDEIAEAALFEGDATKFVTTLIKHAVLDLVDGRTLVHEWQQHGGKLVEKKSKDLARKKSNPTNDSSGMGVENSRNSSAIPQNSQQGDDGKDEEGSGRKEKKRKEEITGEENGIADAPTHGEISVESKFAKAIRNVCEKTTAILSPKDHQDLVFVLKGFKQTGVTLEQVEQFEKNWPAHWMGRNGEPPSIMQLYEQFGAVLALSDKNGTVKNGKSNTGGYASAREALAAKRATETASRDG